jgi:hypothetical protein
MHNSYFVYIINTCTPTVIHIWHAHVRPFLQSFCLHQISKPHTKRKRGTKIISVDSGRIIRPTDAFPTLSKLTTKFPCDIKVVIIVSFRPMQLIPYLQVNMFFSYLFILWRVITFGWPSDLLLTRSFILGSSSSLDSLSSTPWRFFYVVLKRTGLLTLQRKLADAVRSRSISQLKTS